MQLKLSEVTQETSGKYTPLITRYANSQNKVSDADFFSNHELDQRLEQISHTLRAPAVNGAQYGTFRLDRRLVNFRPSKIDAAPLTGARHLDWQVCDSELEAHRGYLRMDDEYVRVLTLKELPSETRPLLLQGLLDIPANFHVMTEWHPVDNAEGRKEIASRRRRYHNSKTSFLSNLQDTKNAGPQDTLVDDSKAAAVAELGSALTAIGMEGKHFGEFTLSVVIYDEDRIRVEQPCRRSRPPESSPCWEARSESYSASSRER